MACITDQQQVNAVTLHLSGLYANFEFDLELAMSFSTALTHNDSQAINLPADVLKVEVRAPGQERIISPEGHSWDQFSRQEPHSVMTFWLSGPVKPRSSATTCELEIPAGHEHRDLRAQAPSTGGVNSLLISLKKQNTHRLGGQIGTGLCRPN